MGERTARGSAFAEPNEDGNAVSDVHWLGHEACHETSTVGGKAASLSRLASIHTVPPGFAVPALEAKIDEPLPARVETSVRSAYALLAERIGEEAPSVAVRSSAIDEDSEGASFAGQHDTYLNVIGADAVVAAVARCCGSARSPTALAYRKQQGLSLEDVRIAVLVQQLVASDISAVVFSANPLTGSLDEVVINASWGLGESVVGGTVTPDTYIVSKAGLTVSSRTIAEKERMTVIVPADDEQGGGLTRRPGDRDGAAGDKAGRGDRRAGRRRVLDRGRAALPPSVPPDYDVALRLNVVVIRAPIAM